MVLPAHPDTFTSRHLGSDEDQIATMLKTIGCSSVDEFIQEVIPEEIRIDPPLADLEAISEYDALARLRSFADENDAKRSLIGMGYHAAILPPVIQRNLLENPGWYTAYTPYQAEISQGRMEALLNFQTMINDLTGMDISNASLLDEATAAAEAVAMCAGKVRDYERTTLALFDHCHPQTKHVVHTRAREVGIEVVEIRTAEEAMRNDVFAVLAQYPDTLGEVHDFESLSASLKEQNRFFIVAADIMALALLPSPGSFGADVVVGSTQRFGLPLGWGGPHAGYFATRESFKRQMPGRLIGVSRDAAGNPALRLSLQTREQHIRRDKATSNICTAQVLPAVIASMYAVYHGPAGLRGIARRIHQSALILADGLRRYGVRVREGQRFDTVVLDGDSACVESWIDAGLQAGFNFRRLDDGVAIAMDERTDEDELNRILSCFGAEGSSLKEVSSGLRVRDDEILGHPVFHRYRSETDLMRYLKRLENKDISLTHSMIPLGSCTMKLNAAAEMMALSWSGFADIHPFAPREQVPGYLKLCHQLESWLCQLTGFSAISLQPNAGSQGEYAGLLAIKKYQESIGQAGRHICLIPESAHGTNFASAVMMGYTVVVVPCDDQGNIDLETLTAKADEYREELAAAMITYPSTHGVFEVRIKEICSIIHEAGGQVYMDGANMNAQVGLTSPASIGADVCHLNLHKTFCIPHGGGGPGMGPIGVVEHLKPFLPRDPLETMDPDKAGAIAATPYGSGCILTISWAYIAMMGGAGLKRATELAILNANYLAVRLGDHIPILYKGSRGRVAHECILDFRNWKKSAGIEVEDIAKRLIDYGFHAPTMSWPVPGTLMMEPTESENIKELDRFVEAMTSIYHEMVRVISGEWDTKDNPLKNAPHTAEEIAGEWVHGYTRKEAAYPLESLATSKYWCPVKRVDNVYGDRNLFCSCGAPEEPTSAKK